MAIYFSAHYRVLSFLLILMAYSITTNTRFAGSNKGTFLNDLTSRMSSPPSISSCFLDYLPESERLSGNRPITQPARK